MARTPEALVKDRVKKLLKAMSIYYFMPATYGFGRSGVPDFVCCMDGRFMGIECKAGTNKPTALQQLELTRIAAAGGFTFVANEDNLDMLEEKLTCLQNKSPHSMR